MHNTWGSYTLSKLSRSIDGLVAVVTGAGGGMGAATAKLFADQEPKLRHWVSAQKACNRLLMTFKPPLGCAPMDTGLLIRRRPKRLLKKSRATLAPLIY